MSTQAFLEKKISGGAVRERFLNFLVGIDKDITLSTEKPEAWFQAKFDGFCISNPDCFSKVRG